MQRRWYYQRERPEIDWDYSLRVEEAKSGGSRCKWKHCAALQKKIRKKELKIGWPKLWDIDSSYPNLPRWFHLHCFAKCDSLMFNLHGLERYYEPDEIKGFDQLKQFQQKKVWDAVYAFYGKYVNQKLSNSILDGMKERQLRRECDKRLLLSIGNEKKLRERLKKFFDGGAFLRHDIDLLVHGFVKEFDKKHRHLFIPLYLTRIIVKFCPTYKDLNDC